MQDPTSKAFFDGSGWDHELERARTFDNVAQAEALCEEYQFSSALIVVKFDNPNHDFSYPVGARGALLVSKPQTTKIKSLY
ncbi:MAG TPA: hypothetical protein VH619_08265 [Verrucomicrobiae bacterium]|nr:hypothetical protein [Verrucomicrobiae bacterium]